MTRLMGVIVLSCLALPVLRAQEPEFDRLGKEAVRLLNAGADELEAMFKDPPEPKAAEAKIARLQKELGDMADKIKKLPPESERALNEKYLKDLKLADERFKAARAKFKDVPPEDAPKQDSLEAIVKRIQDNNDKAVDRLKKNDPGKDTVKIQDDIIKDLNELLKQNDPNGGGGGGGGGGGAAGSNGGNGGVGQKPPMNPMGNDAKDPKGNGNGGGKDPKGDGNGGGKDPKQDKDPKGDGNGGGNPKDDKGPKGGNGGGAGKPNDKGGKEGGGMGAKGLDGKLNNADNKIGEWGQLPQNKRQEMDAYAKEQFMRRYEEQLRQYYRAIAEQSRRD